MNTLRSVFLSIQKDEMVAVGTPLIMNLVSQNCSGTEQQLNPKFMLLGYLQTMAINNMQ